MKKNFRKLTMQHIEINLGNRKQKLLLFLEIKAFFVSNIETSGKLEKQNPAPCNVIIIETRQLSQFWKSMRFHESIIRRRMAVKLCFSLLTNLYQRILNKFFKYKHLKQNYAIYACLASETILSKFKAFPFLAQYLTKSSQK